MAALRHSLMTSRSQILLFAISVSHTVHWQSINSNKFQEKIVRIILFKCLGTKRSDSKNVSTVVMSKGKCVRIDINYFQRVLTRFSLTRRNPAEKMIVTRGVVPGVRSSWSKERHNQATRQPAISDNLVFSYEHSTALLRSCMEHWLY